MRYFSKVVESLKEIRENGEIFLMGLSFLVGIPILVGLLSGGDLIAFLPRLLLITVGYVILFIWVGKGGLSRLNRKREIKDRLYKQYCKNKINRLVTDLEKNLSLEKKDEELLGIIALEISRIIKEGNLSYHECGIDYELVSDLINGKVKNKTP